MQSNVDLYLAAVRKQLICNRNRKKIILQHLAADIEDRFEEREARLTMEELERSFGTPLEIAEILLHRDEVSAVNQHISKRKIALACLITFCTVSLIALLGYIAYDNWRKEDFTNGYAVETVAYDESEIPEHFRNPPSQAKNY